MNQQKGQILIELLLAVAIAGVIAGLAAQLTGVSLRSVQVSSRESSARMLAEEAIESSLAVSQEKWHNIYNLAKGTPNYYYPFHQTAPVDKWVLLSGQENVTIEGVDYTRSLYFENVNREEATENITASSGLGIYDDPSTQKLTVVVSWNDGSVVLTKYLSRWKNETVVQTNWFGSSGTAGPVTNFGNNFFTDDANLDYNQPPGSITLRRGQ